MALRSTTAPTYPRAPEWSTACSAWSAAADRWTMTRYTPWWYAIAAIPNLKLPNLTGSMQRAGLEEPARLEPIAATFLPCMPPRFIELLLLPTEADMQRLQGLIQNPIWWKGAD